MFNFQVIYRSIFSSVLVLILLFSQNLCAAEALVHDSIPHSHSTNDDTHSHGSKEHHNHDEHGTSHEHHNNSQDDSCCKNQTPALLSSAVSSAQLKSFIPVYLFALQSFVSFNLQAPFKYVWLANSSPPRIDLQSQLISSLSISPNAPPFPSNS